MVYSWASALSVVSYRCHYNQFPKGFLEIGSYIVHFTWLDTPISETKCIPFPVFPIVNTSFYFFPILQNSTRAKRKFIPFPTGRKKMFREDVVPLLYCPELRNSFYRQFLIFFRRQICSIFLDMGSDRYSNGVPI